MSRDLTIRLLGRPRVSVDGASGLQKLVRRYVVQGPRASQAGISDADNPLFLAIGTADEEFDTYLLTNQSLEPSEGTMDKAYLTREFIEFKNTWSSESVSDGGQFKQVSRKYAVLKTEHAFGYETAEWAKHPANTETHSEPWDYLPASIKSSEPTDSAYGTGFSWTRKAASIVSSEAGLDIWQVSWFEPIRPTGRPAYSVDPSTKLNAIVRKYHVTKELADDLNSELYNTNYAAGVTDPENSAYFLVDLQVKPSLQADISVLVAKYLKLTASPIAESFNESIDLIRVRKRFAILRSNNANVGYGSSWSNHPSQGGAVSNPWDYAPENAKTNPAAISYDYNTLTGSSGLSDTPVVVTYDALGDPIETGVGSFLSSSLEGSGLWLQGTASVSRGGSELDIWTLEWVTHANPYWTIGTTSRRSGASNARRKINFDHYGIELRDEGGTVSGSVLAKAKTVVGFHVSEQAPDDLTQIAGGSYTSTRNASVNVDLFLEDVEGKSWGIKQNFKNAVWTSGVGQKINFPNGHGADVEVANFNNFRYEFNFNAMRDDDDETFKYEYEDTRELPRFQMKPVRKIGGRISWTITSTSGITTTGNVSNTSTSITPIFSGEGKKIWKVAITYVGG